MFEEIKEKYALNEDCLGDIEKIIQSETDKVRTKYTIQIKELEQYKPKQKTEEEIEYEKVKTELSELKFKEIVKEAGLNPDMAKYLKQDTDLKEFGKYIKGFNQSKQDYVAKSHAANAGVTKEQFSKMTYDEKAKLYAENPTLYAELKN